MLLPSLTDNGPKDRSIAQDRNENARSEKQVPKHSDANRHVKKRHITSTCDVFISVREKSFIWEMYHFFQLLVNVTSIIWKNHSWPKPLTKWWASKSSNTLLDGEVETDESRPFLEAAAERPTTFSRGFDLTAVLLELRHQ